MHGWVQVIQLAHLDEISELSTDSTVILLGCAKCDKTISPPEWKCNNPKCNNGKEAMSCSLCHLPVKAL